MTLFVFVQRLKAGVAQSSLSQYLGTGSWRRLILRAEA